MTILFLLPLNAVWSTESFNLFSQTNKRNFTPITLEVSEQTTWNEQGGGEAIVKLKMTNMTQESCTGELRLVILAINGRIDFNAVTITVLERPPHADTDRPKKDTTYASFLVEDSVMLGKDPQDWQFKIILPADSRRPNMALQLFILYRGKTPTGDTRVARKMLWLSQPSQDLADKPKR